jgi:cell division protein FtsI (penicillin-binding protein 3)
LFALAFLGLTGRLVEVGLFGASPDRPAIARVDTAAPLVQRADIVDRNGVVLATSLDVHALYADTRLVDDPIATTVRLAEVLPDLDVEEVGRALASGSSFVWIHRSLTPGQVHAVNRLGEPGLDFLPAQRRFYPTGRLVSHVIGYSNVDTKGLAGIEMRYNDTLRADPTTPLRLSLDIRFQHVLRTELAAAVKEFRALGGAGVVLDVETGELLAMVSLPDFEPNEITQPSKSERLFNRAVLGVYEMGSTFKAFTTAMALDAGTVTLTGGYDASKPLRVARFTIRDYHAQNRWLSVPEIFMHSSNIGAAKMALDVGAEGQRAFLTRLGLLSPAKVELPEVGRPIPPPQWKDVNVATVGFGHGIAVSPLQLATGIAALVNDGELVSPTLIKRAAGDTPVGTRVIKAETSYRMRQLMRLVVERGTGRKADAIGYPVGGKTGTAEKITGKGYDRRRLLSSFVGVFPINQPRYVVLAVLDEPKGHEGTHNRATGGWTAAPVVGRVIARIGPMAGIEPVTLPTPDAEHASAPLLVTPDGTEIRLASF